MSLSVTSVDSVYNNFNLGLKSKLDFQPTEYVAPKVALSFSRRFRNMISTGFEDDSNSRAPSALRSLLASSLDEGQSTSYSVTLGVQPYDNVVITPSFSSNCADRLSVNPSSITFNAGNYNIPQSFTLMAIDNDIAELNDEVCNVLHTARSALDARFNGESFFEPASGFRYAKEK